MNIYRVDRTEDYVDKSEYGAMIVAAENEEAAKRLHPEASIIWNDAMQKWVHEKTMKPYDKKCWVTNLDNLTVELLGQTDPKLITPSPVLLATLEY